MISSLVGVNVPAALAEHAAIVEEAIDMLLPLPEGPERRLIEAMRYATLGGGKRLRGFLVMEVSGLFGVATACAARVAASVEMLHAYSLVHDDLPCMDDDDLRRGKPTCHRVFGEDVAILAGDGLYAEAFSLLMSEQEADPPNLIAAARELAGATGVRGMVGGQYIDVSGRAPSGADGLRRLHELKTGRLIAASIECVLLLAGSAEPGTMSSFRAFADELGVLFQIVDDILDVTGSQETLGKQQGSDERLGKRTYVTEFGLDGARELAEQSHDRARAALAEAAPTTSSELQTITDFIVARTF
jgi:geranylgeranyl diphosphate synthase type II